MSLVKRYVITFSVLLIAMLSLLFLDTHYALKTTDLRVDLNEARRPIEHKQAHVLTGMKDVRVAPLDIANQNEGHQISFAKSILTTRYTYNTANAYASNRAQLQKQFNSHLWDRVKDHEFSTQQDRIGKSIIAEDRSSSNYISASAYVPTNVLPERNLSNENIPIYYLVTTAYTNNPNNTATSGKQTTLLKIAVDAKKKQVNDYQVISREDND